MTHNASKSAAKQHNPLLKAVSVASFIALYVFCFQTPHSQRFAKVGGHTQVHVTL